jgi:hypothetical protein
MAGLTLRGRRRLTGFHSRAIRCASAKPYWHAYAGDRFA